MDRPRWPPDQPSGDTSAERERHRRLDHLRRTDPPRPASNPPTPEPAPRPDQPRQRWYAQHAAREQHIENQRHADAPTADPEHHRRDWYRHHERGQPPAPFRPDIAALVPDRSDRTKGRLDRHTGGMGLPIDSGSATGYVDGLERRLGQLPDGYTRKNRTHTEAHAAAYLWLHPDTRDATLYLNRPPCGGAAGCRQRLPDMLPNGTTLTIYAPGGFWRTYHGQAQPSDQI